MLTDNTSEKYKYVFHFRNSFIPGVGYSNDLKTLKTMKKDKDIDHFFVYDQENKQTVYEQ